MKIDDLKYSNTRTIISQLVRLCKDYNCMESLKRFFDDNMTLTHDTGRGENWPHTVGVVKNRKRNRPSDTPINVHNMYDAMYKEKFGIAYRSESLFNQLRYPSTIFGKGTETSLMYIFPQDDAKFAYNTDSKESDFFIRFLRAHDPAKIRFKQKLENRTDENTVKKIMGEYDTTDLSDENLNKFKSEYPEYYEDFKVVIDRVKHFLQNDVDNITETNDLDDIVNSANKSTEVMAYSKNFVYLSFANFQHYVDEDGIESWDTIEEIFEEVINENR